MFGTLSGESSDTIARKRRLMADAMRRWPFLTRYDITTIHNQQQLVTIVRDRSGQTKEAADSDVQEWIGDKQF